MDRQQKGQLSNLLQHTWFFGNTLQNKSKSSKTMVRSNSDPCPSSNTTKDVTLNSPDYDSIRMNNNNNLRRAPSLPISLGKDKKYELVEEEAEDEDEPRMGDLIRQAMPMPVSTRRLDRMSSLPPCRVANEASNVQKGEKLCRNMSVESSSLLQEKGPIPIAMTKLTRRASIDSSLMLPPKYNSKGTKQNPSNSKNKTPRKKEETKMNNNPAKIDHSNIQAIDNKIKSQKSISALEIKELQGFKDLGFSTDNKDVSSSVTQIRPRQLQRKASLDSKVMKPYFSDPPPAHDWVDPKATSSQDMKAQIKFWARAVASNVHQEC
ncbi:uncharacterized protein LOC141617092 [Silene latifolia]|uniref:uncharacterized protein LOC141617092 n=1 Tax=Silene latifolia TaxID=37657 RepID=UPI003D771161